MGWLGRLFASPAPAARAEPELRRSPAYAGDGWGAASLGSGCAPMHPHEGEALAAVAACVSLVSGSIAAMPVWLTEDTPDGQGPAPPTASAWRLLRRPCRHLSWPACWSILLGDLLTMGNGLGFLRRDARGAITEIVPVPWRSVVPKLLPGANGWRLAFDLVPSAGTDLLGVPGRMLDDDVLHLKLRGDAGGWVGRSVLSRAPGVLQEGAELSSTAESLFRNGLALSGFVETGGAMLSEEQRTRFKASLAELRGSGNTGKTMLLEGPFKYNPLSSNAVDSELLASRAFSVSQICAMFSVPAGLIQPGSAKTPYPEMVATLAQLCLRPLVAIIESEVDAQILPPGQHLSIDMAGMERGSYSGLAAAQAVLVQSGIATPNDGRRAVGLPAHADGDALRPGNAPSWPADGAGLPHLGPSPGKTGPGQLPNISSNEGQGAGG